MYFGLCGCTKPGAIITESNFTCSLDSPSVDFPSMFSRIFLFWPYCLHLPQLHLVTYIFYIAIGFSVYIVGIHIYTYLGNLCFGFFVVQCSIH